MVEKVPLSALIRPVQLDVSVPIPPAVLGMSVAFHVPVVTVPNVVMVVLPVLGSKAMVPNSKVVLTLEAAASSSMVLAKAVRVVVV